MQTFLLTAIGAFIGGLFILAPTQKDIQKCVETTNYSYERCEWEMTK
jgi:hypothetical protein